MIKFVVVLLITAFMTGCSSSGDGASNYVKANRYSNCIEKLSDSGNLTYDEMKEVCSEYLKWLKLNFLLWLRMVNMDLSKEELQLIYLGLHTISTSYVIKGDLESVFLNLLDKVSIEIDK